MFYILTDTRSSAIPVSYTHLFGAELDQTIADMKTGNYENALIRFETRIGSPIDVYKRQLPTIARQTNGKEEIVRITQDVYKRQLQAEYNHRQL